jgi:hypothetical protein
MNSEHINNINWKCHACRDYGCFQCDYDDGKTLQLKEPYSPHLDNYQSVVPPFTLPPPVINYDGKINDNAKYNGIGSKDGEFICECGYKSVGDFTKHIQEHEQNIQNKVNVEYIIAEHNDGTFSCECGAVGLVTALDHLKSVHKMKEPILELSLKQKEGSNEIELNKPRVLEKSKVFNCLCLKCSNIHQVTTKMNLVVQEVVIGDCQECEINEVIKEKRRLKYKKAQERKKKLAEENTMKFSGKHLPTRRFKPAELRPANYKFNENSISIDPLPLQKKRKEADVY